MANIIFFVELVEWDIQDVMDVVQDVIQNVIQDVVQGVVQKDVQDVIQDVVQDVIYDIIQDVVLDVVQDVIKDVIKNVIQDVLQDVVCVDVFVFGKKENFHELSAEKRAKFKFLIIFDLMIDLEIENRLFSLEINSKMQKLKHFIFIIKFFAHYIYLYIIAVAGKTARANGVKLFEI